MLPRLSSVVARPLVGVRDAVAVGVDPLGDGDPPVDAVAQPEQHGGQRRGGHRPDEDAHLRVLVPHAAGAERELPDQERDGEPDAAEQAETDDVPPAQVVVELGAGEARDQPGGDGDADGLADDEAPGPVEVTDEDPAKA